MPVENTKALASKSEIRRRKTLVVLRGKQITVTSTRAPLEEAPSSKQNTIHGQLQVATSNEGVKKYFSNFLWTEQVLT
jgi:hypothetical protein